VAKVPTSVDEQRGAVIRQVAEQHRVDEGNPDPDDAEQRYPHRADDPVAVLCGRRRSRR
jgi:hypothetical protein